MIYMHVGKDKFSVSIIVCVQSRAVLHDNTYFVWRALSLTDRIL